MLPESAQEIERLRLEGNELFKAREFAGALHSFSEAIESIRGNGAQLGESFSKLMV